MEIDGLDISPLKPSDYEDWLSFSLALFPQYTREEMEVAQGRRSQLNTNQTLMAKVHDRPVGYVTISIRTDYVEGTSSSPVGYLESIFVAPDFRNRGVARALYDEGESWCRQQGCIEMGSDTWDWNKEARDFHKQLGFKEVHTLTHFRKNIDP